MAYLVCGFPGLVVYKAVNTADSMIGHRNRRYRSFGWASARADDLLNLVPARVSALLIALAAGTRGGRALRSAWKDASKHVSVNAGWPEAAMAGALNRRLGGPREYGEEEVSGAWLGEGTADASPKDIERGLRIYVTAMLLMTAALASAAALLS